MVVLGGVQDAFSILGLCVVTVVFSACDSSDSGTAVGDAGAAGAGDVGGGAGAAGNLWLASQDKVLRFDKARLAQDDAAAPVLDPECHH